MTEEWHPVVDAIYLSRLTDRVEFAFAEENAPYYPPEVRVQFIQQRCEEAARRCTQTS